MSIAYPYNILFVAAVITFIFIAIRNKGNYNREQTKKWHNDSANWKFGIFYYNPDDKRIFPPKRVRWAGWTVNFANPFSIIAFIAFIVVIIIFISSLIKS